MNDYRGLVWTEFINRSALDLPRDNIWPAVISRLGVAWHRSPRFVHDDHGRLEYAVYTADDGRELHIVNDTPETPHVDHSQNIS